VVPSTEKQSPVAPDGGVAIATDSAAAGSANFSSQSVNACWALGSTPAGGLATQPLPAAVSRQYNVPAAVRTTTVVRSTRAASAGCWMSSRKPVLARSTRALPGAVPSAGVKR
jgi:hypothetical protein